MDRVQRKKSKEIKQVNTAALEFLMKTLEDE